MKKGSESGENKLNSAVQHFIGQDTTQDDQRNYQVMYTQDTLIYLANVDLPETALAYIFWLKGYAETKAISFKNQFNHLINYRNNQSSIEKILFIAFEPAGFTTSHFIFGLLTADTLLFVNPLGWNHDDFYEYMASLKLSELLPSVNVYISTTVIQKDTSSVVSCGPLSVKLLYHFSKINSMELKLAPCAKVSRNDFEFFEVDIKEILPTSLRELTELDKRDPKVQEKLEEIRLQHFNLLSKLSDEDCERCKSGVQKHITDKILEEEDELQAKQPVRSNREQINKALEYILQNLFEIIQDMKEQSYTNIEFRVNLIGKAFLYLQKRFESEFRFASENKLISDFYQIEINLESTDHEFITDALKQTYSLFLEIVNTNKKYDSFPDGEIERASHLLDYIRKRFPNLKNFVADNWRRSELGKLEPILPQCVAKGFSEKVVKESNTVAASLDVKSSLPEEITLLTPRVGWVDFINRDLEVVSSPSVIHQNRIDGGIEFILRCLEEIQDDSQKGKIKSERVEKIWEEVNAIFNYLNSLHTEFKKPSINFLLELRRLSKLIRQTLLNNESNGAEVLNKINDDIARIRQQFGRIIEFDATIYLQSIKKHEIDTQKLEEKRDSEESEKFTPLYSHEFLIPADGDCLYTTVFIGYLLPVLGDSNRFSERLTKLLGVNNQSELLRNYITRHYQDIDQLKSKFFKNYILQFRKHMKVEVDLWGGANEIKILANALNIVIRELLQNPVDQTKSSYTLSDKIIPDGVDEIEIQNLETLFIFRTNPVVREVIQQRDDVLMQIARAESLGSSTDNHHYRLIITHNYFNPLLSQSIHESGNKNSMQLPQQNFKSTDLTVSSFDAVPRVVESMNYEGGQQLFKANPFSGSIRDKSQSEEIVELKTRTNKLVSAVQGKQAIHVDDFIKEIKFFIKEADKVDLANQSSVDVVKANYEAIMSYFKSPDLVKCAVFRGGMAGIHQKYAAKLLRAGLHLNNIRHFDKTQALRVTRGMNQLARLYKTKRAYTEIYKGIKFSKAGLPGFNKQKPITQPNPIQRISKNNIMQLINQLKTTSNITNKFGLRSDEIELFELLLNLPYKLQHATNFGYPILNSGCFNSYTEIKRVQPEYESSFSTKGNIRKLGNGGFIFFRVFVDPINSSQTRYGDTSFVFDMSLLRKNGWVSLHDQLKPFPKKAPNTHRYLVDKRLLRTSEVIPINNKTKDKNLHDGILYRYRQSPITSYTAGRADPKTFRGRLKAYERRVSFLNEIFYGEDILVGIALSVLYELRCLEHCGYRQYVLYSLSIANAQQKNAILGDLLKNLFRIEGKYPVGLKLEIDHFFHNYLFTPIPITDYFKHTDRTFKIINPDGDGRYYPSMEVNPKAMYVANLREEQKRLEERIGNCRKQSGRANPTRKQELLREMEAHEMRLREVQQELSENAQYRGELTQYFLNWNVDVQTLEKVDTSKLKLIVDFYEDFLIEKIIDPQFILEVSSEHLSEHLEFITEEENLYKLVDDSEIFLQLMNCTLEDLQILAGYDIEVALSTYGYSLPELLQKYREDPLHLTYLTCDDLTDLVLEEAPDIDPLLLEYAKDGDVDFRWVMNELGESEREIFALNIGYYYEDQESSDCDEEIIEEDDELFNESDVVDKLSDEDMKIHQAFLQMMRSLGNCKTRDDAEVQKIIEKLVSLGREPEYLPFFIHIDGIELPDYFRDLYMNFCYGSLVISEARKNEKTNHSDFKLLRENYVRNFVTQQRLQVPSLFFRTEEDSLLTQLANNSLEKLDLSEKRFLPLEFIRIMSAFRNNKSVICLNLQWTKIQFDNKEIVTPEFAECAIALADAIKIHPVLKKIYLIDFSLTKHDETIRIILTAAKENVNIIEIRMNEDRLFTFEDSYDYHDDVEAINRRAEYSVNNQIL